MNFIWTTQSQKSSTYLHLFYLTDTSVHSDVQVRQTTSSNGCSESSLKNLLLLWQNQVCVYAQNSRSSQGTLKTKKHQPQDERASQLPVKRGCAVTVKTVSLRTALCAPEEYTTEILSGLIFNTPVPDHHPDCMTMHRQVTENRRLVNMAPEAAKHLAKCQKRLKYYSTIRKIGFYAQCIMQCIKLETDNYSSLQVKNKLNIHLSGTLS